MKITFTKHEKKEKYDDEILDIYVDGEMTGYIKEDNYGLEARHYNKVCGSQFIGAANTIIALKKKIAQYYEQNGVKQDKRDEIKYLPEADSVFYPTPGKLCGEMIGMIDWKDVYTILEPSAGKGDLVSAVKKYCEYGYGKKTTRYHNGKRIDVDCIEIDENLRYVLSGKQYRVVHDDFMTYNTQKRYDLIIMNPPFSVGAKHLLRAIEMQRDGGQIVCLLNAETIRNPFTAERKLLTNRIEKYGAKVKYVEDAFKRAERPADVEVAIVYFDIPKKEETSTIFDRLSKAQKEKYEAQGVKDVAPSNGIELLLRSYELESALGVEFLKEYNAIAPRIMSGSESYDRPLISLKVRDNTVSKIDAEVINDYLRRLRLKYWEKLLSVPELTRMMTSKIRSEYEEKISEMQEYEFSEYNINQVILDIKQQVLNGIEEGMDELFDKLSAEHAYYDDCKNNIHYYNGWKTNKAHKVNYKVIIPLNGYDTHYDYDKHGRLKYMYTENIRANQCYYTLSDLEQALSYLDGKGATYGTSGLSARLWRAEREYQTKNIDCRYFSLSFFKKGTCHITFNDEAKILVDKLNIFAGKRRNWLPPQYGKKAYRNMTKEEQQVVLSFDGDEETYNNVYEHQNEYLIGRDEIMKICG